MIGVAPKETKESKGKAPVEMPLRRGEGPSTFATENVDRFGDDELSIAE